MSSQSLAVSLTTAQTSSSSTDPATTSNILNLPTEEALGGTKHVQSYIYPFVAFLLALLVGVLICRLTERKRMRQRRYALEMAKRANAEEDEEDPPVMYEVYLDKSTEPCGESNDAMRWHEILPLSSIVVVNRDNGAEPSSTNAAPRAIDAMKAMIKSTRRGVLVVLDALALYDKFPADQRRLEAERRRVAEAEERTMNDPRTPRHFVTGVIIAMPNSERVSWMGKVVGEVEAEAELYEADRMPDVVVGVSEKRWQNQTPCTSISNHLELH